MFSRPVTTLALAVLSLTGLAALRKRYRQHLADKPQATPAPLQTWEGEGGGLPDGGPVKPRATTNAAAGTANTTAR